MNPAHPLNCSCDDCRLPDDDFSDRAKIVGWRLHQLIEAGYPTGQAARIAKRPDIDLHVAVELVTVRGCPPDLAARIVT